MHQKNRQPSNEVRQSFKWIVPWSAAMLSAMLLAAPLHAADDADAAEHTDASHDQAHDSQHKDGHGHGHGERTSRISDDSVTEIKIDPRMTRPKPLLELGPPFLGSGKIGQGIELPTGAVWQPQLLVFGTYRTALQSFHDGDETFSEWAHRLDLYANLQLSGTERLLVGIRPLDEDGVFTGYYAEPDGGTLNDWEDATNLEITTLFFEGDLGEIFPNADPHDQKALDLGFSVGRQPLNYQDGMLINDDIDAIGVIRNTLLPVGGSDLQGTFIYGWNQIHRDDNLEDDESSLFGAFFQADLPVSTVNVDFVYVDADDSNSSGFFWGGSSVQRIGHYNTTFRVLQSYALDNESAAVSDGTLLFSEVSWTPAWGHDLVYVNGFAGIDNFSSAARGPATGGPLGRVGLVYSAVGIGRYGAAISNRADDSVGAAVGYQKFLDHETRKQIVFEVGGRAGTASDVDSAIAAAVRYQQAFKQNFIFQADAFVGRRESRGDIIGGRVEFRVEF